MKSIDRGVMEADACVPGETAGEAKAREYADRIRGGEDPNKIFDGLPPSFRTAIEKNLGEAPSVEGVKKELTVPPQYAGLPVDILEDIWEVPVYLDPKKTEEERAHRSAVLAKLRADRVVTDDRSTDNSALTKIRAKLGIDSTPETHGPTGHNKQKGEGGPRVEQPTLDIESRKKLKGWSASYELARVAMQEGLDLSTLSREEYVAYAIKQNLAIDDDQLRASPWQRMGVSAEDIVRIKKQKRDLISEDADKAFANFCFEMQKKAGENNRQIEDGVAIRSGTKDSNSWLFFKINNGRSDQLQETFKSYIAVKDLNKLTPDRFKLFMRALKQGGYEGDIKIFQDVHTQAVSLNDQIVMHGNSEENAKLAIKIAEEFFGDEIDQKSYGKDVVVNGKELSYSQILAQKIKDSISGAQ